jgi:hypothetical protein
MHRFFGSLSTRVRTNGVALLVVGHSTWNKAEIPTTALFRELAGDSFSLEQVLTYPVKNRYMSYDRRNSASIDREYVLVMRRTTAMTQGPSRKVLVRRGGGVRPVSDATRRSNSS